MTGCMFLFALFFTLGLPQEVPPPNLKAENSVFFIETNTVFTTQSKWLTTFLLDIKPYEHLIESIKEDIHNLKLIIQIYMSQDSSYPQSDHFKYDDTACIFM